METTDKLTQQNKINILKTMIYIMEQDHPEFEEENTTGWDMMENAKIFLDELKSEKQNVLNIDSSETSKL